LGESGLKLNPEALGANQSSGRGAAHKEIWSWWLLQRADEHPRPIRALIAGMETPLLPPSRPSPALEAPASSSFQEPSSAHHHQVPHPSEEPEYICRYTVTKHSWRGKYKRLLCLSPVQIITLDPATLQTTNAYDVATDYESAAPVAGGREDPLQQHALEFTINLRTEGRGKFKSIRFSSRYTLPNHFFVIPSCTISAICYKIAIEMQLIPLRTLGGNQQTTEIVNSIPLM
jgi:hypothetical protein